MTIEKKRLYSPIQAYIIATIAALCLWGLLTVLLVSNEISLTLYFFFGVILIISAGIITNYFWYQAKRRKADITAQQTAR
jgi:hypothetical protein